MRAHAIRPERDAMRNERLMWVIVVLIICLITALFFAPAFWIRTSRDRDLAGSSLRHGTAQVLAMTARPGGRGNMGYQVPLYQVRFQGKDYEVVSEDIVQVGKPATIEYKIGRSGEIYIERLFATKP